VSHFELVIAVTNLAVGPTQPHPNDCPLLQIQTQNFLTILYSETFAPRPSISHQREQITPLSSSNGWHKQQYAGAVIATSGRIHTYDWSQFWFQSWTQTVWISSL